MRWYPNPKGIHHPHRPAHVRDRSPGQWTQHECDTGPDYRKRYRTRGDAATSRELADAGFDWTEAQFKRGKGLAKAGHFRIVEAEHQLRVYGFTDDATYACAWRDAASDCGVYVEVQCLTGGVL